VVAKANQDWQLQAGRPCHYKPLSQSRLATTGGETLPLQAT